MESRNIETKPGTALKTLMEERQHLVEFVAMVQKRIEIEKKHLDELRSLQATWNPKWSDSRISTLISPFLSYISNEIADREQSHAEIQSRLENVSVPAINKPHPDFDPLSMPENLEACYANYTKCHDAASASEAQKSLQKWYNNWTGGFMDTMLPPIDRDLRKAVLGQQWAVDTAQDWYSRSFPAVLDRHQQSSEDVKSFLKCVLNNYSGICFKLSSSCSIALNNTAAFVSTRLIAPLHEKIEKEVLHPLLQKCDYRNYMTDGKISRPLVCLNASQRVDLILRALNSIGWHFLVEVPDPDLPIVFGLERKYDYKTVIESFKSINPALLLHLAQAALVCDTPLIPVTKQEVSQYRRGLPRSKIRIIIERIPEPVRKDVFLILQTIFGAETTVGGVSPHRTALYLTHDRGAVAIVADIWRKWDYENDRPLPEGVERDWSLVSSRPEVKWKKDGRLYLPQTDSERTSPGPASPTYD